MNKPKLTILCGPPCSGKSTFAKDQIFNDGDHGLALAYINQDSQGKMHKDKFATALLNKNDIIVDRMGFSREQRQRFIGPAKATGYETEIIVFHENRETLFKRGMHRLVNEHHETITKEEHLHNAINMFFAKYERPTEDEADNIIFKYPDLKLDIKAIICDIDGTAAAIDHRLHHVRGEGKPNWRLFFQDMHKDEPNLWCRNILTALQKDHIIVMCSGRPDNHRQVTETWLKDN